MSVKNLEDALVNEMRDLLSAEKQLMRALKQMAKKASNPALKEAFEEHQRQTEVQAERLQEAFGELDMAARSKTCKAMQGLLEEGKEIMEEDGEPAARDAMMIAAAQKVEHYEIASYGTAVTWAKQLGHERVAELLRQTLEEEKATDTLLTELAESSVNEEARV